MYSYVHTASLYTKKQFVYMYNFFIQRNVNGMRTYIYLQLPFLQTISVMVIVLASCCTYLHQVHNIKFNQRHNYVLIPKRILAQYIYTSIIIMIIFIIMMPYSSYCFNDNWLSCRIINIKAILIMIMHYCYYDKENL